MQAEITQFAMFAGMVGALVYLLREIRASRPQTDAVDWGALAAQLREHATRQPATRADLEDLRVSLNGRIDTLANDMVDLSRSVMAAANERADDTGPRSVPKVAGG